MTDSPSSNARRLNSNWSNTARARWYTYLNEPSLENRTSVVIALVIAAVIVFNIVEVIFASIPEYSESLAPFLWLSFHVLIVFFFVEYMLRIWVAAETPHENKKRTLWQRRRDYIFSPMGVVDLLSFLPFVLILILPSQEYTDLRILKLFSMARIFKLTRYSFSLSILFRVYEENKEILLAAFLVILSMTFVAAAGIYVFERNAQPDAFGSIPQSMWWALVTLTTVGYGDVTPITLGGKLFGSLVIVCGVSIAAIPAGIFASSFVQLMKEQERQRRMHRRARSLSASQTQSSDSSSNGTELDGSNSSMITPTLHLELSRSEQREVDYLMQEFDLTLDQAIGVVAHFRH